MIKEEMKAPSYPKLQYLRLEDQKKVYNKFHILNPKQSLNLLSCTYK